VAAGLRRTDSSFETFVPTGFTIAEQTQSTSNWGGVGQASLSYKGEMTYASLTASRDITPASGQNGTVERTALTLSTDHRFSYDFHGSASTSFFINKSGAGQFAAVPVNFVTFNIVPAVRYEFGRERPGGSQYLRDMFVEASYTFTRIEDKEADTNGNRSLFMIRFFAQHALLE